MWCSEVIWKFLRCVWKRVLSCCTNSVKIHKFTKRCHKLVKFAAVLFDCFISSNELKKNQTFFFNIYLNFASYFLETWKRPAFSCLLTWKRSTKFRYWPTRFAGCNKTIPTSVFDLLTILAYWRKSPLFFTTCCSRLEPVTAKLTESNVFTPVYIFSSPSFLVFFHFLWSCGTFSASPPQFLSFQTVKKLL